MSFLSQFYINYEEFKVTFYVRGDMKEVSFILTMRNLKSETVGNSSLPVGFYINYEEFKVAYK